MIANWRKELTQIKTAWLSLDEFDDDPLRFLSYFIADWQSTDDTLGLRDQTVTIRFLNGWPFW
ncbi:MAG: ATP/maltotriose-dependent transcriptional regulator MalT [Cellvibrionaceae bacterium]|jgi:ATP/maltotriose-dependent transcriptional regulator MalT